MSPVVRNRKTEVCYSATEVARESCEVQPGPRSSSCASGRHHGSVQSTLCGRPVSDDRPLIMAIVNRTPDSFYDRGANFTDDAARAAAGRLIAEGADVIDVGGVKAGPGESIDA